MNFSIEIDNTTKKPLAVYVGVNYGEVFRTVEVEEDACYVDEDKDGKLLGVEFLSPGEYVYLRKKVTNKYASKEIDEALDMAAKQLVNT